MVIVCVEEYRIRNDRVGKYGVIRDYFETIGVFSGCFGSGVYNKTFSIIKVEVG